MTNHSAVDQRNRILRYLKKYGSATTIELRHQLDVLQPAARVFELRHIFGYDIMTTWVTDINPSGGFHRVAKYILISTPQGEAA